MLVMIDGFVGEIWTLWIKHAVCACMFGFLESRLKGLVLVADSD
jgi:hypothetical protein